MYRDQAGKRAQHAPCATDDRMPARGRNWRPEPPAGGPALDALGREVGRNRPQLSVRGGRQTALEAVLKLVATDPPGEVLLSQDLDNKLAI
jgi:hypothetical protein